MTEVKRLYIFDLDGVITNPENSNVNNALLERIHELLVAGNPIAVNTGRSYDWVGRHLITFMENKKDPALFKRIIVVCEKGGESIVWTDNQCVIKPSRYALNKTDYTKTKIVFDENAKTLDTMFWDGTKRTMATIEKCPNASLNEFQEQQIILTELLHSVFDKTNVRIDATTIATDVESPAAGKYAGAEIIHDWADANFSNINEYICFGDSISDFDMALCFADQNITTDFVYVGKSRHSIPIDPRIKLIVTENKFDSGALAYLTNEII